MTDKKDSAAGKALRPRARIMRTLGEELISSETVALIELVKNSYDADAGFVWIHFDGPLIKGMGSIVVEDDGHGMSLETVETAWMEPATNYKKKEKSSKFLGRRLLGEKGVGRFAAARLAEELELVTRPPENDHENYAFIDWSQFDNDEAYLDEVTILSETRPAKSLVAGRPRPKLAPGPEAGLARDGSHGTVLTMNRLKRDWGAPDLEALKRSLNRLISPFEPDRAFRIFVSFQNESESVLQELEAPEVIKFPHYTLSGEVFADGVFKISMELHAAGVTETLSGRFAYSKIGEKNALEIIKEEGIPAAHLACGPFAFKILVWDRDQLDNIDQKLGVGLREIRRDLDSVAGISIFRDGFRVLPYGEPENDWLKLDLRRVQNPTLRLSNNQITGYITISSDCNPLLKDQSNREGLDNNRAYAELQDIVRLSLSLLESHRFKEKAKKGSLTSSSKEDAALLSVPDTAELRQRISSNTTDPKTLAMFDAATKSWEDQIVRIREVLSRYHTLATLGQLVDKVIHDGRQPLSTIQTQASLLLDSTARSIKKTEEGSACHALLSSLRERLLRVKDAAALIDLLLKRIEPLGGRRRGKPTKVYINEVIKSAFDHFQQEIKSLSISVNLPESDDLIQVDAHELQEVLINLISNSVYWLSKVPVGHRSIIVQFARPSPDTLEIIFADSGPGIPTSNKSTVFEPYFTTKPDGVGLGLVIAGEIIRDYYNGSLELLNSGPLAGAVFRITLRKRV